MLRQACDAFCHDIVAKSSATDFEGFDTPHGSVVARSVLDWCRGLQGGDAEALAAPTRAMWAISVAGGASLLCNEGAIELCADLLDAEAGPQSTPAAMHYLEHVVATVCNLACVDGTTAQFDAHPVTAGLLAVCRRRPLSDRVVQPVLSALWVLLPHQRPMQAFLAHDGLEAVVGATEDCKSVDALLALVGIVRMLTLSPQGLAEVGRSTAPRRVCDVLRQHASSTKGKEIVEQSLGVLQALGSHVDTCQTLLELNTVRILMRLLAPKKAVVAPNKGSRKSPTRRPSGGTNVRYQPEDVICGVGKLLQTLLSTSPEWYQQALEAGIVSALVTHIELTMEARTLTALVGAAESIVSGDSTGEGMRLFLAAGGLDSVLDCVSQTTDRTAMLALLRLLAAVARTTGSLDATAAHFDVEGILRHAASTSPAGSAVRREVDNLLDTLASRPVGSPTTPVRSPLPPIVSPPPS
eukprot:m.195387 g.195387  ORF g.195387 m.195387 type:complete len:467 (+) comp19466_c0_seq1:50-1450(+)